MINDYNTICTEIKFASYYGYWIARQRDVGPPEKKSLIPGSAFGYEIRPESKTHCSVRPGGFLDNPLTAFGLEGPTIVIVIIILKIGDGRGCQRSIV